MVLDQSLRLPEPVVVLGGGGFIGSRLVERLVRDGYSAVAVDVEWRPERERYLVGAQRFTLDMTITPSGVDGLVRLGGTTFHLAADMGGVGYFHGPADWRASAVNARITLNAIHAAVASGVERFVYASSACACAIEASNDRPLVEDDVTWGTPDARYGAEKRRGIQLCQEAPIDARVAILHTVYGPGQEHEGERMKFPAAVATKALAARETGKLEMWGSGEQLRSYLYVDDAIDRLMLLASHPTDPGPVMIGARGMVSCNEIARLCLELAGAPDAEIVHVDGPIGVNQRDADLTKWRSVFGEPHQTSYRDGFARFIEWLEAL